MHLSDTAWFAIGLISQALFAGRFILQWLASEARRSSYVPLSFWYLSIVAGVGLLAYSIYRRDPVFIFGQSAGLFVYARNLALIHRSKSSEEPPARS